MASLSFEGQSIQKPGNSRASEDGLLALPLICWMSSGQHLNLRLIGELGTVLVHSHYMVSTLCRCQAYNKHLRQINKSDPNEHYNKGIILDPFYRQGNKHREAKNLAQSYVGQQAMLTPQTMLVHWTVAQPCGRRSRWVSAPKVQFVVKQSPG